MGPLTPLPLAWIERLFERFAGMYGSRYADMWGCVEPDVVKATWAEELAGFSGEEIGRGLLACQGRDWPPSLPEFKRYCRPALAYEAAFYEAVQQLHKRDHGQDVWSHSAIYWAAISMSSDLMAQSYSMIKGRWQQAMDRAYADVNAGTRPSVVPASKPALPEPGQSTPSKEFVRSKLDEMRRIVNGGGM